MGRQAFNLKKRLKKKVKLYFSGRILKGIPCSILRLELALKSHLRLHHATAVPEGRFGQEQKTTPPSQITIFASFHARPSRVAPPATTSSSNGSNAYRQHALCRPFLSTASGRPHYRAPHGGDSNYSWGTDRLIFVDVACKRAANKKETRSRLFHAACRTPLRTAATTHRVWATIEFSLAQQLMPI